mmetsp:Transcript_2609/g.5486  ORF Transcript_2609/g.5486 Transcript_2609/m.5486 type:complete len:229 (+) Transcript_2609:20-706(+)
MRNITASHGNRFLNTGCRRLQVTAQVPWETALSANWRSLLSRGCLRPRWQRPATATSILWLSAVALDFAAAATIQRVQEHRKTISGSFTGCCRLHCRAGRGNRRTCRGPLLANLRHYRRRAGARLRHHRRSPGGAATPRREADHVQRGQVQHALKAQLQVREQLPHLQRPCRPSWAHLEVRGEGANVTCLVAPHAGWPHIGLQLIATAGPRHRGRPCRIALCFRICLR